MKKKLLILIISFAIYSTIFAENHVSVGVGAGVSSSPYKGVDVEENWFPFFDVRYGNIYLKGYEAGYDIYNEERVSFSIFTKLLGGYEVEGSDLESEYSNIDERDHQIEVGAKGVYDTGWYNVKVGGFFALGQEGNLAGINASKLFFLNDQLLVVPRVYIKYLAEDYNNYYFGVTQNEVDRAAEDKLESSYDSGGALTYGMDVDIQYFLNKDFSLMGFFGVGKFSEEIDDSPIVGEDIFYKVGVGAKYSM